jgi:WD40 repeat protein
MASSLFELQPAGNGIAAMPSIDKRAMFKPLGYSFVAFAGFALIVGGLAVPHETRQVLNPHRVSIKHLIIDQQQGFAFALCRGVPARNDSPVLEGLATAEIAGLNYKSAVAASISQPHCLARVGDQLFVGQWDCTIRRISLASGDSMVVGQHPMLAAAGLAGSSDGRWLVSWGDTICVWDLEHPRLLHELPVHPLFVLVSADSETLYCADGHQLTQFNLMTGKLVRTLIDCDEICMAALSADGRQLASLSAGGELRLTDLETGAHRWTSSIMGEASRTTIHLALPVLTFTPQGDRLLCAHHVEDAWGISVWNADTGAFERSWKAHEGRIQGIAFVNPEIFYSWADDCTLKEWKLSSSGEELADQWNTENWSLKNE